MTAIRIAVADRVMTVTLDRPAKKNAITDAMYGAIAAALTEAAASDAIHAVLIAGEGEDFCAGNDIGMFVNANAGDIAQSNVGAFLDTLSTFPKPLVAAVTGRAIGIGVTMLLHCDLVFVAADAQLATPFVDLGLVPEAASALLIPARIGHVRAFALFALGERLSGTRAAELGIANQAMPASAVAATKQLMRDAAAIAAALAADRAAFLRQLARPEAAAAFAAFAARKP
jgi:enoyl-CoA hydratase/carnithine racemase